MCFYLLISVQFGCWNIISSPDLDLFDCRQSSRFNKTKEDVPIMGCRAIFQHLGALWNSVCWLAGHAIKYAVCMLLKTDENHNWKHIGVNKRKFLGLYDTNFWDLIYLFKILYLTNTPKLKKTKLKLRLFKKIKKTY